MNDAQLRRLAEAFYEKMWAQSAKLATSSEREFWVNQYLAFARGVSAAAREADRATMRLIRDMAKTQYERLSAGDRMLNIGAVLKNIIEIVDATIHAQS